MVYIEEFYINTEGKRDVKNITEDVTYIISKSGIRNGIAFIFVPHATCALFANEDEPRIREDYLKLFEHLIPKCRLKHDEIDDNAGAHLLSSIFKQFFIFPIRDGRLIRGTWQELFLAEFDGPRARKVVVVVLGE